MNHEEMPHVPNRYSLRISPMTWVQAILVRRITLAKVRARMSARMYNIPVYV